MAYRGGRLPLMYGRGWDLRNDPAGEVAEAVRQMIARNPVESLPVWHAPSGDKTVFQLGLKQHPLTSVAVSQTMLTECTRDVYELVLGRFMDVLRARGRGDPPPAPVEPKAPAEAPVDGRTREIEVE